ncbi:MAG TPA: PIN domain-containing protein [Roseiarcus sp.]|nr:PIN domain-containing protein [Roseiarcus sp.]
MTVRCFVDTNVLVYAARPKNDEPEKSKIANMVIQNERFCLSVQVLQEFYVAAKKTYPGRPSARPLSEREAAEWVGWLEQFCEVVSDVFLVQQAIETARNFRISYWDAAIVAAAARAAAPVLYSEDLNHGQRYGAVQVINPFRLR